MIYCTAQGIQPIFYKNYKWNIYIYIYIYKIYKDSESLCGIPETNIIL